MLPPPKPGLQNILCASSKISYLSTTLRRLLPGETRPFAHVHAACGEYLVTVDTHVEVTSVSGVVRIPDRLHFRPLDVGIRVGGGVVTVVVAGADGAMFGCIPTSGMVDGEILSALPGSGGYAIVILAMSDHRIAAAAMDGRVAIWRSLHQPAESVFDNVPLSGDRVTDMKFVHAGLLIAWWSGRLTFHDSCKAGSVLWTMDAVCVTKHVFAAFPGCYLLVRANVVAMSTGRGDLVFVRLADGRYCKGSVGKFVKGLCEYDEKLHLVVDGKLVTREWMSKEQLDKIGVMTSVRSRTTKGDGKKDISSGDKHGL